METEQLKTIATVAIVAIVFFVGGYFTRQLTSPSEKTAETWQEVLDTGEITVATSPDWPPYEFRDPDTNEITGFEVELLEECITRLGDKENTSITVNWKDMDFGSIIPAVKAKTVHLGVSGFSITEDRLREVQYTTPHSVTEGQILAMNTTVNQIAGGTIDDLSEIADYDLTIAVQSGTTQEKELQDLIDAGTLSQENLQSYGDYIDAMNAMVDGKVDGVYAESPITYAWMNNQYSTYNISIMYRRPYFPVAFVLNRDADMLCSKLSGMISTLTAEGWIADLREKYGMI